MGLQCQRLRASPGFDAGLLLCHCLTAREIQRVRQRHGVRARGHRCRRFGGEACLGQARGLFFGTGTRFFLGCGFLLKVPLFPFRLKCAGFGARAFALGCGARGGMTGPFIGIARRGALGAGALGFAGEGTGFGIAQGFLRKACVVCGALARFGERKLFAFSGSPGIGVFERALAGGGLVLRGQQSLFLGLGAGALGAGGVHFSACGRQGRSGCPALRVQTCPGLLQQVSVGDGFCQQCDAMIVVGLRACRGLRGVHALRLGVCVGLGASAPIDPGLQQGHDVGAAFRASARFRRFTRGDFGLKMFSRCFQVCHFRLGASPGLLQRLDFSGDRGGCGVARQTFLTRGLLDGGGEGLVGGLARGGDARGGGFRAGAFPGLAPGGNVGVQTQLRGDGSLHLGVGTGLHGLTCTPLRRTARLRVQRRFGFSADACARGVAGLFVGCAMQRGRLRGVGVERGALRQLCRGGEFRITAPRGGERGLGGGLVPGVRGVRGLAFKFRALQGGLARRPLRIFALGGGGAQCDVGAHTLVGRLACRGFDFRTRLSLGDGFLLGAVARRGHRRSRTLHSRTREGDFTTPRVGLAAGTGGLFGLFVRGRAIQRDHGGLLFGGLAATRLAVRMLGRLHACQGCGLEIVLGFDPASRGPFHPVFSPGPRLCRNRRQRFRIRARAR